MDNAAGCRFLTGLHAHETAPDEDAAAVQESRDDVTSQQGNVCPRFADVRCEVLVQSSCQGSFGILLARRLPEQCCALCIDFIGSESIMRDRVVSGLRRHVVSRSARNWIGMSFCLRYEQTHATSSCIFFLPRVSYYTLLSTTQRHPQPRLQQTPSSIINPTPTAAPQSVVVERVNRSLRLSRLDLFSSPPRSSNLSTSALADAPQFNKGRSLHSWLRAWSR